MKTHLKSLTILLCMTCGILSSTTINSDQERIITSQQMPPQTLAAKHWKPSHPENLKVTDGGKYGATVTLNFLEDQGELCKDFFPYIYGKNPMLNSVRLNLHLKPETYNQFNQLSLWIYPDTNDRAALWFDMGGSGLWTQACCPLRPRQWNKISVCWSQHTPEQARNITFSAIARQCFGRLPGDPKWSTYYAKDLTLERVAVGTERGWQPSTEKIILPQTGFAPHYTKRAILNDAHPQTQFQIVQKDKIVYEGKLKEHTYPTGTFKIADFTDFQTPGFYRIKSGNLISQPFQISARHLHDLAQKNANFLLSMRSGTKTPAHPECFLDDCIRSDNRQPMDVSGGWFDASDLRGYHSMAMKTILRPLAIGCLFNTKLYDEAQWGARQLVKLFDEKTGLPVTVHALYPKSNPDKNLQKVFSNGHFFKVNNYWTDNKPGTGDERAIHVAKGTYICHPDLLDSHWGMTAAGAYFKLIAKTQDKKLADLALQKCQKHFDRIDGKPKEELAKDGIGYYYPLANAAVALRLENAVAFYQISKRKDYLDKARKLAHSYLIRQQRSVFMTPNGPLTGYFRNSHRGNYGKIERDDMGVLALTRLATILPQNDDLLFRIQAALRIHADFFLMNPSSCAQPYATPYISFTTDKAKNKATFQAELGASIREPKTKLFASASTGFLSGPIGSAAMQTQALAAFLHDPKLQEIAASYLTFHTGANPFGKSFIADVGTNYRNDIMSSALGWIPGMMSNPQFVHGLPNLPYHRHYGTNEIYTQTQAGYAVAAAMIDAPAKLTLKLKNCPENATLTISDHQSGKQAVTLERLNETQTVELPGGFDYDFRFSHGPILTVPVISGEIRTLDWNLDNCVQILPVDMPQVHRPGARLTAKVKVRYWGAAPRKLTLRARTEGMRLDSDSVSLMLEPGKETTFTFNGTATQTPGTSFVFMVYPADRLDMLRSAAAVTVSAP